MSKKYNNSFYWYDYETFGIDPRIDRIAQFAGIRTDMDFNIIDEPIDIYCKASNDILPNPDACLITGITPQKTLEKGLIESDFIQRINDEFSTANTCVVGFNNIRFDDEFTRYSLYRNFLDPYAREWQNGCSRWDIIDLVRITRALRPEGIEWPVDENGVATNRLELITKANGISHESAHDALSDVYATIGVAKLIKTQQPKLFNYVLQNKSKQKISQLVNLINPQAVLHTSGMYPGDICNSTVVYPIGQHPTNKNGIIVFDLRYCPEDFLTLSAEQIIERLYTPRNQLPEGVNHIPIKTIHINKCPVLAPLNTLDKASIKRLKLDTEEYLKNLASLKSAPSLKNKIHKIFSHNPFSQDMDPDKNLYGGGFFSAQDKQQINEISHLSETELAHASFNFKDPRLPEMLFRYRARNYPQSLSEDELSQWDSYRKNRFNNENPLNFSAYMQLLIEKLSSETDPQKQQILKDLQSWGIKITANLAL